MSKAVKTKEKEIQPKEVQSSQIDLEVEEIAERAYLIWESNNCCHGHDKEHWLQAEKELTEEKLGRKGT